MIKSFSDNAWEDYEYWQRQNDKQTIKRIHQLIKDIDKNGYTGIGKPEPLKHDWAGWWSRRITDEHRLIYKLQNNNILLASMRYHYPQNKK